MVGYAPLIVRTVNVMPIFSASCWIIGDHLRVDRADVGDQEHVLARLGDAHAVLVVSYFEPFIAAFAFATLPWSPGVPYGL